MGRVIIEDTRNKVGHHSTKHRWWEAHGVEVVRRKLDYGDYARADPGFNVYVDTKQDVQELAGNCGREHARFVRELERARADGSRLYVLVEEHPEYERPELIETWVSGVCRRCRRCNPLTDQCRAKRRKPMNGPQLRKILDALHERHGAYFMFCDRRETARIVSDILGIEYEK